MFGLTDEIDLKQLQDLITLGGTQIDSVSNEVGTIVSYNKHVSKL